MNSQGTPGGLPETMRAVVYEGTGGPEVLRIAERAVPQPGEGQVLIRTFHAGLNRPDIMQRQGLYPPPEGASDIPGLELAGEVVAAGPGVDMPMAGQTVAALVTGGAHAQYCLADHRHCLPVPAGLSPAEAAALPETMFTVWHNLFERGYARDGETALIHGGTSGIGTLASRLARLFGITVITTNGSAEKCAASLAAGADHAIDYKAADFVEEVKRITGGRGVDIVLDMVGGDYLPRNMNALADEGRCLSIAVQRGIKAEINVLEMMSRRLTLTGSTLRARPASFKALLTQEIAAYCWPLVEDGRLRPVMDRVVPFEKAAEAHARMDAGEHVGKIVLDFAA